MIDLKQTMKALIEGKVLIDGQGNRLKLVQGTLTLITFANASEPFYEWIDCLRWQIEQSSNWWESMDVGGVLCWVWDNDTDRENACIDWITGKQSVLVNPDQPLFYSVHGNFWNNAYPLTTDEINSCWLARQHLHSSREIENLFINKEPK